MNSNNLKGGVCQKRRPSVQECHATKNCPAWFRWNHYKVCVFVFADETTWIYFSTQENGKIILFIRSGLYICRKVIFVVSVLFRKASWTKNAVNLYTRMSVFCTLAKPLGLLNTYFSCLAFLFPTFTKFTTGFRKWHNANI